MADQIKLDKVTTPDGSRYDLSTIRTYAGGGANYKPLGAWLSDSDYADDTPWPFETMVFRTGTRVGLYHEAHGSLEEANARHAVLLDSLRRGLEFPGDTVKGPKGNPALTAEQWHQRQEQMARI